jgi:hypothetical protein
LSYTCNKNVFSLQKNIFYRPKRLFSACSTAKKLDLYDPADLNLTQFFIMRKILDRAIEKDVLDALREEVDNAER